MSLYFPDQRNVFETIKAIKMYFKRCFHCNRPKYFIYKFTFTSLQLAFVICIEMFSRVAETEPQRAESFWCCRSRNAMRLWQLQTLCSTWIVLKRWNILNYFCYSYLTMTRNQEKIMLDLNCMVTFIPLDIFGLLLCRVAAGAASKFSPLGIKMMRLRNTDI
jgi:hypothetical protein